MIIDRAVLIEKTIEFINNGSGLIVGEPGIGKTYALREATEKLIKDGVCVLFLQAEKLGECSEIEIRRILGYNEQNFSEKLKKVRNNGNKKNILIIDAFDAVRNEQFRDNLLEVVKTVINELHKEWNVIISVRTYDAKKSLKLVRLFPKYKSLTGYSMTNFNCNHFYITELNEEQVRNSLSNDPLLLKLYEDADSRFKKILRNPFNLGLFYEIASGKNSLNNISKIYSQAELINIYWINRVRNNQVFSKNEELLFDITDEMLENNTLTIPKSFIKDYKTAEELLNNQVLFSYDGIDERISFSHNILFDFAVCKLLLHKGANKNTIERFIKDDYKRVIFLRPSFVYLFTILWYEDRERFLQLYTGFYGNNDIPLLTKFIPNYVIISEFRECKELINIIDSLKGLTDQEKSEKIHWLLRTAYKFKIEIHKYNEWVDLLYSLQMEYNTGYIWDVCLCIDDIINKTEDINSYFYKKCAVISRNILEFSLDNRDNKKSFNYDALAVVWGIPFVMKTYLCDFLESRRLINRVVGIIGEDNFPIEYIRAITKDLEKIIGIDNVLIEKIFKEVFGYEEESQERTMLNGSPVIPMISNRRQDYDMCKFQLLNLYKKFIVLEPLEAIEIGYHVLNTYIIQEHVRKYTTKVRILEVQFLNYKTHIIEDDCHYWASGFRMYNDAENIGEELFNYVNQHIEDTTILDKILSLLSNFDTCTYFYKKLFEIMAKKPDTYTDTFSQICINKSIINSEGLIYELCEYINKSYIHWNSYYRNIIEKLILSLVNVEDHDITIKKVLTSIPSQFIYSKELLNYKVNDNFKIENTKPFNFEVTTHEITTDEEIRRYGFNPNSIKDTEKEQLSILDSFEKEWLNKIPKIESIRKILPNIIEILESINESIDDGYSKILFTKIGTITELAFRNNIEQYKENEIEVFEKIIVLSLKSKFPIYDDNYKYDSYSWSNSPRNIGAECLPKLMLINGTEVYKQEVESLIKDDVPTVRFLFIRSLPIISDKYQKEYVNIIKQVYGKEENSSVIYFICQGIRYIKNDPELIESIMKKSYEVFKNKDSNANTLYWNYFIHYFIIENQSSWANEVILSFLSNIDNNYNGASNLAFGLACACGEYLKLNKVDEEGYYRCKKYLLQLNESAINWLKRMDTSDENKIREIYDIVNHTIERLYFVFYNDGNLIVNKSDEKKYNEIIEIINNHLIEKYTGKDTFVLYGHTAYNIIELLNEFIIFDPEHVLRVCYKLLRASGKSGFQFDSLAIKEIVKFVEKYIYQFSGILKEKENTQYLIKILEMFINAGWPEAIEIMWEMNEIYK